MCEPGGRHGRQSKQGRQGRQGISSIVLSHFSNSCLLYLVAMQGVAVTWVWNTARQVRALYGEAADEVIEAARRDGRSEWRFHHKGFWKEYFYVIVAGRA